MLWFLLFVSMTAFAEFSENDFITELGWIEDDQYGMCYGYFQEPLLTKKANLGVNAASISAMDSGRIVGDKIELSGHVNLAYKNAEIKASKAEWYRGANQSIQLQGNVRFVSPPFIVLGSSAKYDTESTDLTMKDAGFQVQSKRKNKSQTLWGQAQRLSYNVSKKVLVAHESQVTICSPMNRAWQVDSHKVILDHANSNGIIKRSILSIYDVPVLYIPWLLFPIDDERRTGFLKPHFAYNKSGGLTILIPYYFNLASNYDLILSPFVGFDDLFGFRTKLRYLNPYGLTTLRGTILRSLEKTRYSYQLNSQYARELFGVQLDYNGVSDTAFINDYKSMSRLSGGLLNRRFDIKYGNESSKLSLTWLGYQDLNALSDESQVGTYGYEPSLSYKFRKFYQDYDLSHSLVYENLKPVSSRPNLPDGAMALLASSINTYQYLEFGGVVAILALKGLNFDLDQSTQSFVQPQFMLRWNANELVYKGFLLQPSVGYLWSPYKDMSQVPLFNTRANPFLMGQLFSFDRFHGNSRLGDYNDIDYLVKIMSLDSPTTLVIGQRYAIKKHRHAIMDGFEYTDPNLNDKLSPLLMQLMYRLGEASIYSDMSLDVTNAHLQNMIVGIKKNW